MSWYDAGGGAGAWDTFAIQDDLKNILHELCTAVNEREMFRASNSVNVSSITRSGSTATATTASAHNLTTDDKVYMVGADQSEYNGVVTVTVTGSTTFTYTVSGSPATPATGTLRCRRPLTKFVYSDAGDTKYFPAVSDFEGLPLSKITNGPQRNLYNSATPTSITSSLGVATVTTTSAFVSSLIVGDTIEISGANQSEYNIVATVLSKPLSTTFTYAVSGSPATPATGTITVKHHGRVTRSGTTVTARLPGHGLLDGDSVTISGSTQSEYNGSFTVTTAAVSAGSVSSITRSGSTATVTTGTAHGLSVNDVVSIAGCNQTEYNILATVATVPLSTTFTYAVSGSPATPATGTPTVSDETRFQFEITGSPASPGTGDMKLTTNRHLVAYATRSGSTATFTCYEHGFSTGDYVEAIGNGVGDQWAFYNSITVTDSNTFTATITGTPTSPWAPTASAGMLAVTKEGEFRKLLRQLQTAIAALLTASTSTGVIRFVEDSAPYETNYTLANLLGAGSYGAAWVSLHKLPRASLGDVLDQMREAVDLLIVTTVTETAAGSVRYTYSSAYAIDAGIASYSGGVTTITSGTNNIGDGKTVHATVWVNASSPLKYENGDVALTVVDATHVSVPVGSTLSPSPNRGQAQYPILLEDAWDDAVADSPGTGSVGDTVSRRFANLFVELYNLLGQKYTQAILVIEQNATYTLTPIYGTFVAGEIYLLQSNNGDVTQDTYVLTDSDGDTADIDASIGTTDSLITVSKTSAFFDSASKTLTFTTPTPASHPFSTALGDNETTERYVKVRTNPASKHTRELVPGTHLTYG